MMYSWRDVELKFLNCKSQWSEIWKRVDVYSECVIIVRGKNFDLDKSKLMLEKIFASSYSAETNEICIDFVGRSLMITYEDEEECNLEEKSNILPLFGQLRFNKNDFGEDKHSDNLPGARVIVFHSYKGGVGRTLSLISFLREYSAQFGANKVLVVDADVEAPGLTWITDSDNSEKISYLDCMSLLHFEGEKDEIVEKVANEIKRFQIKVETDEKEIFQFFLPTYRTIEQCYDTYSDSESIIKSRKNKYVLTDFISKLGAKLDVNVVLVDLRAGIAEWSAPYLLDTRVEKYFVTTMSDQSLYGTNEMLKTVFSNDKCGLGNINIVMTMIVKELMDNQEEFLRKVSILGKGIETEGNGAGFEDILEKVSFEEELLGGGSFSDICKTLKGKKITEIMKNLVLNYGENTIAELSEESVIGDKVERLHELAQDAITAEGNSMNEMLVTRSLEELTNAYSEKNPVLVVMGSKGSGKTYIYRQMLLAKNWENFVNIVQKGTKSVERTVIVPFLRTENGNLGIEEVKNSFSNAHKEIENFCVENTYVQDNSRKIKDFFDSGKELGESDYRNLFKNMILTAFGGNYSTIKDVASYLRSMGKRVLFIVDGIEDIVSYAQSKQKDNEWKIFVRTFCQAFVNEIKLLSDDSIGLIIFVREDLVKDSIEQNFAQFKNQYQRYQLTWNKTEALRLALWLVACVDPVVSEGIDIASATQDIVVKHLEKIWGRKLGKPDSKEAYSHRWILGALSDFKGNLQARDIIRFLMYATENKGKNPEDRWISPSSVKDAIGPCAKEKISEIRTEMVYMKEIFNLLEKYDDKRIPLNVDKIGLSVGQVNYLEEQGFLKKVAENYYMPEFLRQALDYTYVKGARPKVLTLLSV